MAVPALHRKILIAALVDEDPTRASDRLVRLVAGRAFPGLGAMATTHGVESFLYRRVHHLPGVDPDLLADLEMRHHQRMRWSLRTLADLTRAADVLAPSSVPWLACGGPVLSELLYPSPDLRGAVTFDVLTSQRNLDPITRALEASGCRRLVPEVRDRSMGGLTEVRMLLWHGTVVRVGSALVQPSSPDESWSPIAMEDVLDRSRSRALQGVCIRTLDPTDTLLHLTTVSEGWRGSLGSLKDIERATVVDPPEWRAFASRASACGIAGTVGAYLKTAREILNAVVPDSALRAAVPSARAWSAASIRRPTPWRREDRSAPAAGTVLRATRRATPHTAVEAGLLRLLARDPQPPPALTEQEWYRLVRLAVREHVAPLAWVGLRRVGEANAPGAVHELLGQAHRQAEATADYAYGTLEDLLRGWKANGVVPVLLKGAALARSVYPHPALRSFWDIDVLVSAEEVQPVHDVLSSAGYALAGIAPTAADLAWRHGRGYYDRQGLRPSIDVHWRYLGYPLLPDIDYARVARRARLVDVGTETVRILTGADYLVMSSIYFVREMWYGTTRLRYLRDLVQLTASGSVDWSLLDDEIRGTRHLRGAVVLALTVAHRLFGGSYPADAVPSLGSSHSGRMKTLIDRAEANVLRPYAALDSVREITLLRWMDDPSALRLVQWALSLLFVPRALKPSQMRWLRRLGGLPG